MTEQVHRTSDTPPIPRAVQAKVVIRSAWVQASLNYAGMQNLGRLFCLVPVARWLKLERSEWPDFIRRHLGMFNGNPFISPLGIGALARMEADHKLGRAPLREGVIERFSERLSTPLGAVGDELFWAAVRPQMVLLGVLIALLSGVWGPIVFLLGFTVWQAIYRWKTFSWGWASGQQVASVLRDRRMRAPAHWAGLVAAMCAGGALVLLWMRVKHGAGTVPSWLLGLVFVLATTGGAVCVHRRRSATWALVGGVAWGLLACVGEGLLTR